MKDQEIIDLVTEWRQKDDLDQIADYVYLYGLRQIFEHYLELRGFLIDFKVWMRDQEYEWESTR